MEHLRVMTKVLLFFSHYRSGTSFLDQYFVFICLRVLFFLIDYEAGLLNRHKLLAQFHS